MIEQKKKIIDQVVIIDDDKLSLEILNTFVIAAFGQDAESHIKSFTNPREAAIYFQTQEVSERILILSDVFMPFPGDVNAQLLGDKNPNVSTLLVSAFDMPPHNITEKDRELGNFLTPEMAPLLVQGLLSKKTEFMSKSDLRHELISYLLGFSIDFKKD